MLAHVVEIDDLKDQLAVARAQKMCAEHVAVQHMRKNKKMSKMLTARAAKINEVKDQVATARARADAADLQSIAHVAEINALKEKVARAEASSGRTCNACSDLLQFVIWLYVQFYSLCNPGPFEFLAQGTFGRVYKAVVDGVAVAWKVPRPDCPAGLRTALDDLHTEYSVGRFIQAQMANSPWLPHLVIPQLYSDAVLISELQVTDFSGQNWLKNTWQSLRQQVAVTAAIAESLLGLVSELCRYGLEYRDFKLDNATLNAQGMVCLIDLTRMTYTSDLSHFAPVPSYQGAYSLFNPPRFRADSPPDERTAAYVVGCNIAALVNGDLSDNPVQELRDVVAWNPGSDTPIVALVNILCANSPNDRMRFKWWLVQHRNLISEGHGLLRAFAQARSTTPMRR